MNGNPISDDERLPRAAPATVRSTLTTARGVLSYRATADYLPVVETVVTDGRAAGRRVSARVFTVSYLAEPASSARTASRPVIFAFNGGPGSSTMWLHLGLLGPRRVDAGDADRPVAPPYALHDNPESALTVADLVFLDPVGTGYSHVTDGTDDAEFDGQTRDAECIAEAIRTWISRHDRWDAPKYLAGESYGTVRAVAVADRLDTVFGMPINGLLLLSPVLSGLAAPGPLGADLAHALRLPTYAAAAHWHHRHPGRGLDEVRAEAETFALEEYLPALTLGARLEPQRRHATAQRIATLCGLATDFVLQANLRVGPGRFYAELLRDRGHVVSRMDARFTGTDADQRGEMYSRDPGLFAVLGPYASAFAHYVGHELGFRDDRPFQPFTVQQRPWKPRTHSEGGDSVLPELGRLLRTYPHLRVYVAMGVYDGSTPYFASDWELAQLALPADARRNIGRHEYPAGHMMYLHEPSRVEQSAHIREFVAAGGGA